MNDKYRILQKITHACLTSHAFDILGNLTLLASKKDFSIVKEGQTFKHLKYPESFRACLTQTSNMGHQAFMGADEGMTSICLLTKQIPGNS